MFSDRLGYYTKLNRPGTRSNRLGPDPDPADLLKYRPEPVRVLGPRVLREDLYRVHCPLLRNQTAGVKRHETERDFVLLSICSLFLMIGLRICQSSHLLDGE